MICDNDNIIIKETVERAPVTEKMFFDLGFTYCQTSYSHTMIGWEYSDKDGVDTLLVKKESKLPEYEQCFKGEIFIPLSHSERQKIEVIIYNEGQLKLFVELVEQAAELRMDFKRRSDNLKEIIQDKLWKG